MELVLGLVCDLEDKRALRLACKRSRASVDSRVVAVKSSVFLPAGEQLLSALFRAPWKLQRLELVKEGLSSAGTAALAAAHWPALIELYLSDNNLGTAGVASLAAAHWPDLQQLVLGENDLDPAGAASLAAVKVKSRAQVKSRA